MVALPMGASQIFTLVLVVVGTAVATVKSEAVTNLLTNPSFEDELKGSWKGQGLSRYQNDKLHGQYSLKCSSKKISGPTQTVLGMVPGRSYAFQGYVKLLNEDRHKLWQNVKVSLQFGEKKDREKRSSKRTKAQKQVSTEETHSYAIAYRGFVTQAQGWVLLKGDLDVPRKDFKEAKISIRGPDGGVTYLLDNLTLWELPELPDWESLARASIEKHRKSNVKFRVTLPPGVNASDVELQVAHKKHLFAFGSKVESDMMTRKTRQETVFRELFFYLFNWATVGGYKWRFGKKTTGREKVYNLDFSKAVASTNELLAHGIKIRGHSILWGHAKNIPEDVLKLSGDKLRDAINRQVAYIMGLAEGKLAHWDVQNEYISEQYYEEKLRDPNVTIEVFKLARQQDPVPKLYLNDFQAVTTGANTEDYHDLAMRFKAAGTGIQGLGIQGHTKDYVKPNPTMIWSRLDRLAETGLELFMTEFDIPLNDEITRADWFEDTIRAMFAHPGLSGIILWGFWNELQGYPNQYLVYGPDLEIREPGERWACLVKKEWSTHVIKNLAQSGLTFDLRGFQGEYEVIVRKNHVPVQVETFSLGKRDTTVTITVTTSTAPVTLTDDHDFVPQCVSHRGRRSLGILRSTSPDKQMTCAARESRSSGPEDGAQVGVTCNEGEVMTGCSSVHNAFSFTRRGERITVQNGTATCTAFNGANSAKGVRAVAMCCAVADLRCDYRVAGPSNAMDGARAEASCPDGLYPFGCTAYSEYSDLDGAFPNGTARSCLAQSGPPISSDPRKVSGAVVGAACCGAGRLHCDVVRSADETRAKVTCPSGSLMTGCNVYAEGGKTGGARITEEGECTAYRTEHHGRTSTVSAIATCCRPPVYTG